MTAVRVAGRRRSWRTSALIGLARMILRPWLASLRLRVKGRAWLDRQRAEGGQVMFVFWHGQMLPLVRVHQGQGVVVLVSEHGDGELIAGILESRGFSTARGSSTRGGSRGLRELVRAARAGHDLAVTPDGPRGPAGQCKPGVVTAARLAGLPIVPVVCAAERAWYLNSWDRFALPRPFSAVNVIYGPPIEVGDLPDEAAVDEVAQTITRELTRLSQEAGDPRFAA